MSQTAYRTHHATEVTEELVGQKVTLAGWVDRRRDHGGVAFIDLRDNTGLVQIVIYDEEMARPLRSEFVIQVTGEVRLRPDINDPDPKVRELAAAFQKLKNLKIRKMMGLEYEPEK